MGTTHATVTLRNAMDVTFAAAGRIKEQDIRELTVDALVDTGTMLVALPEWVYHRLGLDAKGLRPLTFGNNTKTVCKVTSSMEVLWEDRETECQGVVISDSNEVLLGVIALEGLDLVVNPVTQKLEGAHGKEQMSFMLGLREIEES
jgi:clan AA aspartic protease